MDSLLLTSAPSVPPAVLAVLAGAGAVEVLAGCSPESVDAGLDRLAGRRLVLAGGDAEVNLLVRRLRRRGQLADTPVGLVPLGAGAGLAGRLGLPADPADAAGVAVAGRPRTLDLLRGEGGAVAVDGVRIGLAGSDAGRVRRLFGPRGWLLHVNVDDEILADGTVPLLAVSLDAGDGAVHVTVRGPAGRVAGVGGQPFRYLRRGRGRAATVAPAPGVEVGFTADGVAGNLRGRRSWWVEAGAWSVVCPMPPPPGPPPGVRPGRAR